MKFTIIQALKKAFAAVMAAIMTLTGGVSGGSDTQRPDANTVTPYSTENSDYTLAVDATDEIHDISNLLFGIFFEDINFAADGGLYAEMVVNRSFEFTDLAANDALYGWNTVNGAAAEVKSENGLNENNPHYLMLTNTTDSLAGIENAGFLDGMSIESGKKYNFTE